MFSVGNVFAGLWVDVLLRETKVNDMYNVLVHGAVPSHEKIPWLHVSVYQVLTVHIFNSGYLCVCVCVTRVDLASVFKVPLNQFIISHPPFISACNNFSIGKFTLNI